DFSFILFATKTVQSTIELRSNTTAKGNITRRRRIKLRNTALSVFRKSPYLFAGMFSGYNIRAVA
ncbi:MAG: hypothetical protein IJ491_09050, partial [Clostridia bacterium]|nr:hypothetical protein [Clostridia bacterium]